MDILFVTPSFIPYASQESIGSLILAKRAELGGYQSGIVRFWECLDKKEYSEFKHKMINLIISKNPKIVSFYCRGEEYHIMLDLAWGIKSKSSKVIIVMGGPHADLTAISTMNRYQYIDYICKGEGEKTIILLLDYLLNTKRVAIRELIPGLVYRDELGNVCQNENPNLLPDNYVRSYVYYDFIPLKIMEYSKYVTIDVGRGCPFSCSFCSTKTFWRQKYRLRNIDDILNEINYVRERYGDKIYSFSHDLFTANKFRIVEFCDKIDELPYKIKWTCSSRIDTINENLIDRMLSSGLCAIYYGIETGSQSMQRRINKNLNIERCREIVKYSIRRGVNVITSFIYGFPDEVEEDVESTMQLMLSLLEMGADVQIHRLQFEPGTQIFNSYIIHLQYCTDLFNAGYAVRDLEANIKNDKNIFSIFWDLPTQIRTEMKLLEILHSILKIYPKAYVKMFKFLSNRGFTYYSIYRLFFQILEDSLIRLSHRNTKISQSISIYIYRILLSKLTDSKIGIEELINDKVFQKFFYI